MKIDVLITEEKRPTDFAKTLRGFKNYMSVVQKDVRERARIVIHEAGHAMYFRLYGSDVEYHGPYVKSDDRLAVGAISPKGDPTFGPFEEAAISIAGPLLVHLITGTPDHHEDWQTGHDVQDLRKKLNTTEGQFELAKNMGEFAILADTLQPDFLSRLEAEVRAYEREVYGTDEVWDFAWKDFRLDSFRERVPVGSYTLGFVMWLVPNGETLRLFLHGQERQPHEKVYGCTLEVFSLNPGERAAEMVRGWNEEVRKARRERAK